MYGSLPLFSPISIVCHAGEICEALGVDTVAHSLVATIQSLMSDPQWRIRLEVVNQIPRLAKQFVRGSICDLY